MYAYLAADIPAGNYEASVSASSDVGNIVRLVPTSTVSILTLQTQVLYPNDNMYQGKLLRLKQQACESIQKTSSGC